MSDVILRPWRREDAQELAAIANNRNVFNNVRDSFPSPYTVTDALDWITKQINQIPVTNFAITYEEMITGSAGIFLQDDVYRNTVELGYFIGEAFWNKGIATEAVKVLCNHIQKEFKLTKRITARVFQHNKASMKVLQKTGFVLEGIQKKAAIKNKLVEDVYLWVKLL